MLRVPSPLPAEVEELVTQVIGSGIYRQFPDLDQVYGFHGGSGLQPERAVHMDAGVEHALPRQTRILFNVYARQERDVLWTPGLEPKLAPDGTIDLGTIDAPWVNTLRANARGVEVVLRRDAFDGFSVIRKLSPVDPGKREHPVQIRLELSAQGIFWRAIDKAGQGADSR